MEGGKWKAKRNLLPTGGEKWAAHDVRSISGAAATKRRQQVAG
jgi:hypothetical protein